MEPLFLCYSCNNMLVGNTCRAHHSSVCCKLSPSIRKFYRTMFARNSSQGCLNWIDCNTCDSQMLHRRQHGAAIEAFTKWARMTLRLFHRRVAKAKLLMLTTQSLPDFEVSLILDFAAWFYDKRVQARPTAYCFLLNLLSNVLNCATHTPWHAAFEKTPKFNWAALLCFCISSHADLLLLQLR